MNFEDSNKITLEQHLTNLASRPRIEILKKLQDQITPVEYRELQKAIHKFSNEKKNLSYHINVLKDAKYIIQDQNGYLLTPLGYSLIKQLQKFEEGLSDSSKIKVRTSKYTLEPFDETIIEEKIIEEGNLNVRDAKKIANEAKQRIRKANITYLTAPLIREYVNAILIEHHLEDTRHKLTRLGLPPYDIQQLINSRKFENPEKFKKKLSDSILEQNTLLNKINQKFADNLLSGQFLLSDLKNFGILPLELLVSGRNFIEILNKFYNNILKEEFMGIEPPSDFDNNSGNALFSLSYIDFVQYLERILYSIQIFFPKGLVIIRFDEFLEHFLKYYNKLNLKHLFLKIFTKITQNWAMTLGISLIANFNDINPVLEIYIESLKYPIGYWSNLPVLEIFFPKNKIIEFKNYSDFSKLDNQQEMILKLLINHQVNIDLYIKRGIQNGEHVFSNLGLPLQFDLLDQIKPSIISEKISINLLGIFIESENNEELFFSNLEKSIFTIFDYFDTKFQLLSKNLLKFPGWKKFSKIFFDNDQIFQNWNETQDYHSDIPIFCGVSFYGLDELIFLKSGLFIKDQTKNREFAVKVLDYIYSLIKKQNNSILNNIKYVLCESHYQKELLRRNDQFLKLIPTEDTLSQSTPLAGYRFGFNSSQKFLSSKHQFQIFSELSKSKFKELSVNIPLQGIDFNQDYDKILEFCQEIVKSNIARLSFSKNYEVLSPENPKIIYERYFSKYFSK
ncbi:MAG: DUF7347 domain-containing protein [Promethearchaeota archaeon]